MSLTVKDLEKVREFLGDVESKWYEIGLELKVSQELLDAIRNQWGDSLVQCLSEMLKSWLNSVNPQPTWEIIACALKNAVITDSNEEGK